MSEWRDMGDEAKSGAFILAVEEDQPVIFADDDGRLVKTPDMEIVRWSASAGGWVDLRGTDMGCFDPSLWAEIPALPSHPETENNG